MKSKSLKYSPSQLKDRDKLGAKVTGQEFSKHLQQVSQTPFSERFQRVDLGNGFVEIIPKKLSE